MQIDAWQIHLHFLFSFYIDPIATTTVMPLCLEQREINLKDELKGTPF